MGDNAGKREVGGRLFGVEVEIAYSHFKLDKGEEEKGARHILPANPGTHNKAIRRRIVLMIQGQSDDEQHLVLLTPDGHRLDVHGSLSGVQFRGTGMVALPDNMLKDAMIQASERSSSEPPPPCQQDPASTGPRWVPIPCTITSVSEMPEISAP